MNITLKPEIEKFISDQIKAGHFSSSDEVIEAALARWMLDPEPELEDETLDAIDRSEQQIARGQYRDWKEVSAELRAKYLRK